MKLYDMLVDGRFYRVIKAKNHQEAERKALALLPNRGHGIQVYEQEHLERKEHR